jgi:hypothetical protein
MAEFKLGRIKFVWQGPWATGAAYYKDDVISYGGQTYICIQANTSAATFDADFNSGYWQLMAGGTRYQGGWTPNTRYAVNDIVALSGYLYVCNTGHTSSAGDLTDNSSYWTVYSPGTKWQNTWTNGSFTATTSAATSSSSTLTFSSTANMYVGQSVSGTGITNGSTITAITSTTQITISNSVSVSSGTVVTVTGTLYHPGDLVQYLADVYICTTKHVTTSSFDSTKWNVYVYGLKFENSYSSSTTYQVGDIVTYGGYAYTSIVANNANNTPSTTSSYWSLMTTGFNVRGTWSSATAYKTGDTVQLGGNTYVCIVDNTNQTPYISTGVNTQYWQLVVQGISAKGSWSSATQYYPGDVITYAVVTYICILPSLNNTPPDATHWQLLAQGGTASLLIRGDLAYRSSSGAIVGLSMTNGTVSGGPVLEGYVLKASTISTPTSALEPRYGEYGYISNVWYVAPSGTDDSSHGRTIDRPFKTIKYACSQATGPATIFIKTGTYAEQLPIRVPPNVSLVGDELRTTIVSPAAGTSDDGVTPNNRSRMFLMNSACVARNFSLTGLTGQFTITDSPSGSGVYRLTTTWPSTTASGAYFSLDPTGSISKSPYVQNCSTSGDHAVGCLVDGSVQASGYKSFVLNDFTQVIDQGIGIWVTNGARVEAVSVFTYYSYIGYLTETGGIIRALNGNNSYGTYGDVAYGLDPTDSGYVGTVNNNANQAQFGTVTVGGGQVIQAPITYGGQNYTYATVTMDAPPVNGTQAAATPIIANGVISHVNISGGSSLQFVSGTARSGGTSSSGVWLALAATDKATQANQYLGMRITIVNGLGAGQTGIITASLLLDSASGLSKVVYVKNASGANGWDSLTGSATLNVLDDSTQYTILPEITVQAAPGHAGPTTPAVLRAGVDPGTFQLTSVYILDGGVGYSLSDPPTNFVIVDPLNVTPPTLTAIVTNGAIRTLNFTNRGVGYVTINAISVATGDGYAAIQQTGSYINFTGLSQAPRPGNIMTIAGQSGNFLVVQTSLYSAGLGSATVQISPAISSSTPLTNGASVTVYQKFSQIRLTGHDYLAIGTGSFASTAYPNVSTLNYITANQHVSLNNGRVFYVTTDQDGNLSVGDLFKISQATGQATLNVAAFNLTGLNSLQLGSSGATVYQFSTDATLSANSDNIVPTQKAIRAYISSQLGAGSNNLQVNVITAGQVYIQSNIVSTVPGTGANLVIQPDGSGVVNINSLTNYNYSWSQIASQSASNIVNRDYVDQQYRPTILALTLDQDGNLIYTTDVGTTGATVDASSITEYFMEIRSVGIQVSNTGNLQITY